MRLLLHDYGGYAFVPPLSRELARRGHEVCHAYCASLVTTPQGDLAPRPDDPPTLSFAPLDLGEPLDKANLVRRFRQERRYGRLVADLARSFRPDVVLSGNTPLDAQGRLMRATDARFVFWVQDLIGLASARLLRRKVPVVGGLVGDHYARTEARQLRRSDALVLITDDFRSAERAIAEHPEAHVVPNWAPLDRVDVRPRDNAWAREQGLGERLRVLYTGTLGMKHNPALLAALARRFPSADVLVVSQGAGADWLRAHAADAPNLRILPFQPFERLPEMLGSADVLVAVLEPDAGVFSVPSKVLTYLCAERALLLAVPEGNLAARIVRAHDAGRVAPPTDEAAVLDAAAELLGSEALRRACGERARAYAETHFAIPAIADRFEAILTRRA